VLEGFLGNDFERRLQGTKNFSLLGFLWDRVHESRKLETREKMQVDIPLSNMGLNLFVEGRQKLVRGRISCTGKKD
jgi:hypothetical protein